MNDYLQGFLSYFENAAHLAAGKEASPKKKHRGGKHTYKPQATPDCFNIRSTVRKQDSIRRNPAP